MNVSNPKLIGWPGDNLLPKMIWYEGFLARHLALIMAGVHHSWRTWTAPTRSIATLPRHIFGWKQANKLSRKKQADELGQKKWGKHIGPIGPETNKGAFGQGKKPQNAFWWGGKAVSEIHVAQRISSMALVVV